MTERLRAYWQSRTPSERKVVCVLAAMVVAILYLWLVQSAYHARNRLTAAVTTLRAQAASLDQQAAEYARLRATPTVALSSTDMRALVQAQAAATGLSRALQRIDVVDANQVQVVFNTVAYSDWLNWVAGLQAQQVRLDTCRIEALSTGMVSVTATLVRAGAV